jgi:hypothetical protein
MFDGDGTAALRRSEMQAAEGNCPLKVRIPLILPSAFNNEDSAPCDRPVQSYGALVFSWELG